MFCFPSEWSNARKYSVKSLNLFSAWNKFSTREPDSSTHRRWAPFRAPLGRTWETQSDPSHESWYDWTTHDVRLRAAVWSITLSSYLKGRRFCWASHVAVISVQKKERGLQWVRVLSEKPCVSMGKFWASTPHITAHADSAIRHTNVIFDLGNHTCYLHTHLHLQITHPFLSPQTHPSLSAMVRVREREFYWRWDVCSSSQRV